jgi:uncharacterized protein YlxW (UPF0749 family)
MPPETQSGEPDSSSATIGLLPYLTAHAVDRDYALVAARPAAATPRRRSAWTILALAAFVLLLVTAATQTSKNAVSDEGERLGLIHQLDQRKAGVDADNRRIERLRARTDKLRGRLLDNDKLSAGTRAQLNLLAIRSGTAAVRGPGVSVTVDDAPDSVSDRSNVLDSDLQQLVNGLWQAGAEAIAINGERLTNLTSIRQAGSAISVNYRDLARPYVVQAIGDPATLPARFANTTSGETWLDLQKQVGLQFAMITRTAMSLPAASTPVLRFATAGKGKS